MLVKCANTLCCEIFLFYFTERLTNYKCVYQYNFKDNLGIYTPESEHGSDGCLKMMLVSMDIHDYGKSIFLDFYIHYIWHIKLSADFKNMQNNY